MNYETKIWFEQWCPEFKLACNGATGGWTLFAETTTGGKYQIEFPGLPDIDEVHTALLREIRRRNGGVR